MFKFKRLLLCASAAALVASCTDEDLTLTPGTSELITVQPENDLTFGYNSIIAETDSLSKVSIPLNTDVAPVISCRDGVADLQCVKVDGKYYLQIAHPEKAKLGIDEVTLSVKGHPELSKSFLFTIRESVNLTRSDKFDPDAEKAPILSRFADVFSVGQYLWEGVNDNHPSYPMLDAKKLYSESLIVLDPRLDVTTETVEVSGSSLEEHSKNWSISGGVDKIPIANCLFGLTGSFSTKSVSKNYYEYKTITTRNRAASAKLNLKLLTIPAHDERWKYYITEELDDLLNNEGSDIYKSFGTDSAGACRIIEYYGSHLLTSCELGSNATFEFRKKSDMTQTSMDVAIAATLKVKGVNELPATDIKTWGDVIVADYLTSKRKSLNLNIGYSESDYVEETECETHSKLVGGNLFTAKDYKDWNPTADPKNWVPITYRNVPSDTVFMRAIYEFCQKADSKRCESLRHVIEDVNEQGICPFINYLCQTRHIDLNPKATEWVLADVLVNVNAGRKDSDIPHPIRRKLSNGVTLTFYPYTDLRFEKGKCLDTQTGNFGKCVRYNCHYWYYAMAMRDDVPGLEEIRLVDKDRVDFYTNNLGYHTCFDKDCEDFGDGWSCGETNNFVLMAKNITDGNRGVRPITGMRLEGWEYKDRSGSNCLIGVSGATGPDSYGTGRTTIYDHYWTENVPHGPGYKDYINYVKDQSAKVSPVYFLSWVRQSWYLFLSTTTKPIRKEDAKISQTPSNMKKR